MQTAAKLLINNHSSVRRVILIHRHLTGSLRTMACTSNGEVPDSDTGKQNDYTAGIIVIGDEILKGQVADTNTHFITRHLFSWGVKVKKISVISDDLDVIASEVAEFSRRYRFVITSGGVGPTHDDLTFQGVAKALGETVEPHPHLVQLCEKYFNTTDLSSPKMKMAMVAKSARLLYGEDKCTGKRTRFPLVNVRNIYCFPGVPSILENALPLLKDHFRNPNVEIYTRELYVNEEEITITPILNQCDEMFKRHVTLGSYPDIINSYYKVKLSLESESQQHMDEALKFLYDHLPGGSIVEYDRNPVLSAAQQVYRITERDEGGDEYIHKVRHAIHVIEEAFDKYKLEELCIGFNGGKDCTLLLHLVHAVMKKKYPDVETPLKALYIRSRLPFPEVEKFIQICRDRYKLDMIHLNGRIKDSLVELQSIHPEIKAVIMGTRETDPYSSHLDAFSMTDRDWPQFMRVNPLLNWNYSDIWRFLRSLSIPYCSLYDRGYTSLGNMDNTHPNPSLQYVDQQGIVKYKSAYTLQSDDLERAGRNT